MNEVYFAVIDAMPKAGSDDAGQYEGAQVACWINSTDWSMARKRAKAMINDSGWAVKSIDEEKTVSEANYAPDDEGLQYYKQALVDDEVCVFYTYPLD